MVLFITIQSPDWLFLPKSALYQTHIAMDPLLWWIVLIFLIALITVLSLHLCHSVFSDKFRRREEPVLDRTSNRLTKYTGYQRTDIEDLTSIESKHRDSKGRISFVNEFDSGTKTIPEEAKCPRIAKFRKASLLTDIHENSAIFGSAFSVNDVMTERRSSEMQPKFGVVTEGMRRNSLAALPRTLTLMADSPIRSKQQSTETLDAVDPAKLEVLQQIDDLEDQAVKIDYEIGYFIGAERNLKFYEINNRLIMLSLALTSMGSSSDDLRKRKREVMSYINKCKERLNAKVK